jgi:phosphoglycerate kinase
VGDARLAVHVVSQCQQASSRDTRAMATMAKKSVEDLMEVTIIARLCTYTTF